MATKRLKQKRMFLQQIGVLLTKPSPIVSALDVGIKMPTLIFEHNEGCRDMIKDQRVTTNLDHIGVPFQYMHNLH